MSCVYELDEATGPCGGNEGELVCPDCRQVSSFCATHAEPRATLLCTVCGEELAGWEPIPQDEEPPDDPESAAAAPDAARPCSGHGQWMYNSAQEVFWQSPDGSGPTDADLAKIPDDLGDYQLHVVEQPSEPPQGFRRWLVDTLENFFASQILSLRAPRKHFSSSNPYGRFATACDALLIVYDASLPVDAKQCINSTIARQKIEAHAIDSVEQPDLLTMGAPASCQYGETTYLLDSLNPLGFAVYVAPSELHAVAAGWGRHIDDPTGLAYTPPECRAQVATTITKGTVKLWRAKNRSRTQKAVMGLSANEMAQFVGMGTTSGRGWEWLHLIAHSMGGPTERDDALVLAKLDPQVAWNMAVTGTEETNSRMLILETFLENELLRDRADTVKIEVRPTWINHQYHTMSEFLGYNAQITYKNGETRVIDKWFFPAQVSRPYSIELAIQNALQKLDISISIPPIGEVSIVHRSPEAGVWTSS